MVISHPIKWFNFADMFTLHKISWVNTIDLKVNFQDFQVCRIEKLELNKPNNNSKNVMTVLKMKTFHLLSDYCLNDAPILKRPN